MYEPLLNKGIFSGIFLFQICSHAISTYEKILLLLLYISDDIFFFLIPKLEEVISVSLKCFPLKQLSAILKVVHHIILVCVPRGHITSKSRRTGGRRLGGGSDSAKVLGKLPMPGRPTYLDYSMARAYCACSRCGWGLFGHFFSHLSLLFSFSLSLGDGPI